MMKLLNHLQITRYARHLPLIGQEGQARLLAAKVLCVGAGGLGAPVLQYLAGAGVGTMGIVDGDSVELSNLQRQVIFDESDLGKNKAEQAALHLKALNAEINTIVFAEFINLENAEKMIQDFEIIIDASDNYQTRYLLNDVAVKLKKPLISASIYQYQGQCSVFNYKNGPCYRCLYEVPPPSDLIPNCAVGGVLGVLPGILGCIQATETIKIILNRDNVLSARLLTVDAMSMQFQEFRIAKNSECPCCHYGKLSKDLFIQTKISVPEITPQQLLDKDEFILVDVREPYERDICDMGGLHIPLDELQQRLQLLPQDQEIVLYCKTGGRSRKAVQILLNCGYTKVSSLQGGILAWIDHVLPTLTRY